jgi:spore coat polysaccharide biosynthesis predicted glycosyltransferase SpsG
VRTLNGKSARLRLAVRCDGGPNIGAGHVARCLPLAGAFAARGWSATFVGLYDGLAAWLLERTGQSLELPAEGVPCGLAPGAWDAAIIDSYRIPSDEVCKLAAGLPIATLGEATRCEDAGILIDYHLDRRGEAPGPRLLPGPSYAPLDPALAGAGRAAVEVTSILITVGGSTLARDQLPGLQAMVSRSYPDAAQLVPMGGTGASEPVRLPEILGGVDLAVTAAGVTAYELACAGVPLVAVAIAANQGRVLNALRSAGLGLCVDLDRGESIQAVGRALAELHDPALRRGQSELGQQIFDGLGADRAADGLLERWDVPSRSSSMLETL